MVQWRLDSDFVLDIAKFEKKITDGAFSEAVSLYHGDLLPSCYDEWVVDKRENLSRQYFEAMMQLIRSNEAERDYRAAINYVQVLIRREPVSEHLYRDLMRLHALNGDRAGVIRAYNACAAVLKSELGVEPSVGTQEAFDRCQKMISMADKLTELDNEYISPSNMLKSEGRNDHNTFPLILAGGQGKSLSILTGGDAKPATPFAGKYRVIDFVLSNLVNSNLDRIAILAQFNSQSIIEHVKAQKTWGANLQRLPEIQIWESSMERTGQERYTGTADAVFQNRNFITKENYDQILILPGDQVYHQDYRDLLRFHQEKGADLTIAVLNVPSEESPHFGMVDVDQNQKIVRFVEKPKHSTSTLASMGIYVFNIAFLLECLARDAQDEASAHDFGLDIIPPMIEKGKVYAYRFNGYWVDINTLETYWNANLALLGTEPTLNLHDPAWMLPVRTNNAVPADIRPTGLITNSLISEGCVIEGEIVHSILSTGVQIEKNVIVHDSVILDNAIIRKGTVLQDCLIGVGVEIGANASIGASSDSRPTPAEQDTNAGITVIGKMAHIPAGITIERNCLIEDSVKPDDFKNMQVSSGTTVRRSDQQR
jgi:glucose-1-phosphate adenylyltransferase